MYMDKLQLVVLAKDTIKPHTPTPLLQGEGSIIFTCHAFVSYLLLAPVGWVPSVPSLKLDWKNTGLR
jgi:hypothetical protein